MKQTLFFTCGLLLMSQLTLAQVRRNVGEASQNQQAMATNQAQLDRDTRELAAFKAKLSQLEVVFASLEMPRVALLKADLLTDMQREIEQSERKIAQDQRELAQSRSEVNSSARETNRSRYDRATPDNDLKDGRDVRDDRRDKRDDQRDARDDRSDLERQIARSKRQKEIYAVLRAFTFSAEPSMREKAMANIALLHEFASTMEMDIAATTAEIQEDKRESKEDAKERREDRREVGEKGRNRYKY